MPVSRSLRINVVPVDYVAKAVAQLTFEPKAKGQTFHVVAPYESLPKLGELLDFVQKWAKTELACKLPSPICLPMSASSMKTALKLQRAFTGDRRVSDALISLSPYFSENRQFNRDNLDNLLGSYDFKWQEIMPKLLELRGLQQFLPPLRPHRARAGPLRLRKQKPPSHLLRPNRGQNSKRKLPKRCAKIFWLQPVH